MTLVIERESVERLELPVSTPSDPQAFPVEFAFTDLDSRPETWHAGTWVDASTARTPYLGSGALDLDVGTIWLVWIRINAGAEVPVMRVGTFVIK